MRGRWGRGQSSAEYLVLIVAAVAALTGLRFYLERAVEGRLNDARWQILGGGSPQYGAPGGGSEQFYFLDSNQNVTASTFPVTITDYLGRTGVSYNTQFTTAVNSAECQGRTTSGNVNCQ